MGTQLHERGLMSHGQVNLDAPEAVLGVHRAYAASGCDVLIANTLTMNRVYVETHNVGVSVREVNRHGSGATGRGWPPLLLRSPPDICELDSCPLRSVRPACTMSLRRG